jgi:mono/diheme cytochrome c family protein
MVIAFLVICGVVAVAVWLAATGGSRRETMPGESRAANRGILLAVLVAFAFGVVVPLFILVRNGESKASTAVGVHLDRKEIKGRELFSASCAVCHTLKAVNSVGRIGPILDFRVAEEPTPEARRELVLGAIREGRVRGLGNMPAKLYEGPEAEDIAAFVVAVAGHGHE